MPDKEVTEKAKEDLREGKSASTAAGEFVRAEIDRVRAGKHGVRSPQQAIAIGLSEARRAGIPLAPPKAARYGKATKTKAEQDLKKSRSPKKKTSAKRAEASEKALQKEPRSTVSRQALSAHAKKAARKKPANKKA